jgi:GTPase Era involved in 16S rRNA processing
MEKNFDNKFKIKVIGAVKHGKSTMLNSLIGYEIFSNEILPDSA